MNHFWRLLAKEFRELLRPRYLLPILMVPIVFVAMGQGFGSIDDQLAETPKVGVIDEDDDRYGDLVVASIESNAEIVHSAEGGSPERSLEQVRDREGTALLVIPPTSPSGSRRANGARSRCTRRSSP